VGRKFDFSALLPDGRIFGQITQKRPQKYVHGRKKLEAGKLQNLDQSGRKEAGKYFYNYVEKKPYNSLYFSIGISKQFAVILNFLFAFIVQKVFEKLLHKVCSVVAEFFQIFRLLWPERSETIWQQCFSATTNAALTGSGRSYVYELPCGSRIGLTFDDV
jgi:hypothetical protein